MDTEELMKAVRKELSVVTTRTDLLFTAVSMVCRLYYRLGSAQESFCLWNSKHYIHVLHCLSCCSFDKVIN